MEEEKLKTEEKEIVKEKEAKKAEGEKIKAKEKKKEKKLEIVKKDKAVARGRDLGVSTKQCVAICDFIRNKKIEDAVSNLEKVIEKKIALPMKGEIPHRKGKIMSGRYPEKACKIFVKLLRSLNANSIINGMENVYISSCKADIASRPSKRFGQRRFKRTHVYLEAKEQKNKLEKK